MIRSAKLLTTAMLLSGLMSGPVFAQGNSSNYEVTIYNITKAQIFTPILAVTHSADIALFELGSPSSAELAILAESGAIAPLRAAAEKANSADFSPLWSGQNAIGCRAVPAALQIHRLMG